MCVTRVVGHRLILLFPQPVYRQQMETATRFVHLEQEASQLRAALEQSKSKYSLSSLLSLLRLSAILNFCSGVLQKTTKAWQSGSSNWRSRLRPRLRQKRFRSNA